MWSKTKIRNALRKLEENWNPDYWIQCDGDIHLLKNDENGDMTADEKYVISNYSIRSDGGDPW